MFQMSAAGDAVNRKVASHKRRHPSQLSHCCLSKGSEINSFLVFEDENNTSAFGRSFYWMSSKTSFQ